jgi:hypothetical protein
MSLIGKCITQETKSEGKLEISVNLPQGHVSDLNIDWRPRPVRGAYAKKLPSLRTTANLRARTQDSPKEGTMLSKRTLLGALLAGLGVSLAGCYEPTAYSGAYYGGYGPVYSGGYYTWPYYGGAYYGSPYYGGYYWRRGYVWRPGYYRYPYRHGVYYHSYGGHY